MKKGLFSVLMLRALAGVWASPQFFSEDDPRFIEVLKSGDAEAQYNLGQELQNWEHYTGDNLKAAIKLFEKAAEEGHVPAQYELGAYYVCYRPDAKPDYVKAIKWLTKAAEQGHAPAQVELGEHYLWFQYESLADHQMDDTSFVSFMYHGARYKIARWFKETAARRKAVKWLKEAAEQGNAEGQYRLGECYKLGEGVGKDERESYKWFKKAAEQGHRESQLLLGACYATGSGVSKDMDEAVKWYEKSLEQWDEWHQYRIGSYFLHGDEGFPKDAQKYVKWLTIAADQRCAKAQYDLAVYSLSVGDEDGIAKAVERLRKTAEQKEWWEKAEPALAVDESWDTGEAPRASFFLGVCYEKGMGVPKDMDEAIKWYQRAADRFHRDARKRLKELEEESRED